MARRLDQFLAGYAFLLLSVVVISTLTPLPALYCFHIAWERRTSKPAFSASRILLVLPTALFPVVLLFLHGVESSLDWQMYGPNAVSYMAVGDACWVFTLPFLAANYVVGRTIIDRDFIAKTLIPPLALLSCVAISLYFAIGNWDREFLWCFPLSTCVAYSYGLHRLLALRSGFEFNRFHLSILAAWMVSALGTVYSAIIVSQKMVDRLPREKPDCFIVTAALKGHPFVVGSRLDLNTGRLTNRQLETFRKFEDRFEKRLPAMHRILRRSYNLVAPVIARSILYRWQADLLYPVLKPFELLVRR